MSGITSPMTKPVHAPCSMFGAREAELVVAGDFGKMVAFTGLGVKGGEDQRSHRSFENRSTRALGISLGD
jgi:hypothetical protein